MPLDSDDIVSAIQQCLPINREQWPLHEPIFGQKEYAYLQQCLDDGYVSTVGQFVNDFEKKIAEFTGAKHVIATNTGTAALHINFKLAGVDTNDEVLTPALSFIATSNAINYCGGIPHFIDVDSTTFNVDPEKLRQYLLNIAKTEGKHTINKETGNRIRALSVVHILGHPADLDALNAICKEFNIALIEDAAEALGSYYRDRHVGYSGFAGALSFNGNKIITAGAGGAILTDNDDVAERARHLTTVAKSNHPWQYLHNDIGYNYRLPNINAALGLAQLESIELKLQHKRQLAERYQQVFKTMDHVNFHAEPSYGRSNYWLNAIKLDDTSSELRDKVLESSHKQNIYTRPFWMLHHQLPIYKDNPRMDLSNSELAANRVVKLPSGPSMVER